MCRTMSQEQNPDRLSRYEPSVRVRRLNAVSSTNDVAREYALMGAEEGLVIVAKTQTSGRGRWGRGWQSPKGGLWFTILLRPFSLERFGLISLAAGIAAVRTIDASGITASLKWPNDILADNRKLGGILVEGGTQGDNHYALVGIGINLNISKDALPEDIRETAVSILELTTSIISPDSFLNAFLGDFFELHRSVLSGHTDHLLDEYRRVCSTLGKEVRVKTSEETTDGTAVGIDQDGALLLEVGEGMTRRVLCGEVTSLREKPRP